MPSKFDESTHLNLLQTLPCAGVAVLAGLRVLLVEDDDDTREMMTTVLERAGAAVSSASDAAGGFAAVRTAPPNVLVSDIGMPGEDGYSMMRRIRALADADGGGVCALAVSAFTRREARDAADDAGFNAFLPKPVDIDHLVDVVRTLSRRGSGRCVL